MQWYKTKALSLLGKRKALHEAERINGRSPQISISWKAVRSAVVCATRLISGNGFTLKYRWVRRVSPRFIDAYLYE